LLLVIGSLPTNRRSPAQGESPLWEDIEFQIRTENDLLGPHRTERAGIAAVSSCGSIFAAYLKEIERPGEILTVVFAARAGAAVLLRR
jgi:hypothetical protein